MRKLIPVFILWIGIAIHSFSQPTPGTLWTLQDCIQYALKNNLNIKKNTLNQLNNQQQLKQSVASMFPTANAGVSHNLNYGRTLDQTTYQYVNENSQGGNYFFNSEMTLFDGFKKLETVKQNRLDIQASEYDLQKSKNDISLNICLAFLQILYNEDQVGITQQQIEVTKQQSDKIKKLTEAGSLSEGSLLDIQAQLYMEELELINKQNLYEQSQMSLRQLLDLPEQSDFGIKRPVISEPDKDIPLPSIIDIYYKAEESLPEIKSAMIKHESSKKGLSLARSGRYPQLTMSGGLTSRFSNLAYEINPLDPSFGKKVLFSDQLDRNFSQYIGFDLTFRIFNGSQINHLISKAKIGVLSAEYSVKEAKKILKNTIQSAYADARAALKKYEAAGKFYFASKEAYKYAEQKYTVGMISVLDYNQQKNKLQKAETELLQAKYESVFKLKIIDFYMGNELKLE